jgi:electron transfer flavoprotein beta subunit
MKILVPIKRVFDPYAKVTVASDGLSLEAPGAKFEINPFDEIAMEAAVQIREALGSVEIIAVSIGGAEGEEQLRKALAMGADSAILVETNDPLDSRVVAAELEALVRELSPDLVLMGKLATDGEGNQTGPRLAARLGWPQATLLSSLTIEGGIAKARRETDQGEEAVEVSLPAVFTTDLRLNEPRYIALPGIIKARSKPLARRARATSVEPQSVTLGFSSAPTRPAGQRVNSVAELVAGLNARGAI